MADAEEPPAPLVEGVPEQIADSTWVIPDRRVALVPNVGFVVGRDALLIVDTGMGPENGARILREAEQLAGGRRLLLTLTHFHPEHGFGAQVFRSDATIVYNRLQRDELREKGQAFVDMFRGFGPAIARLLEHVELVAPHVAYNREADIDLGGVEVQLRSVGPAHTRGDQIVLVPNERVLFTGDLVEDRFFPILPDDDAKGSTWIALLERLEELQPALVVPGHGEVGDGELIVAFRNHLVDVRETVRRVAADGRSAEEAAPAVEAEIRDRYADWENPDFIGWAVERFRSELA
ncbi:MAG: MBL fold metallo-hydrolase [Actinomycetota bacterium]|nr:MBL fold metallo-hydrolase [Actinomycetota bacterium]